MASQGKGGKRKGSNFERRIAKVLSKALGKEIKRSPGSGGFDKTTFPGDVYSKNGLLFNFELKDKEQWSFKALFSFDTSPFASWWEQSSTDINVWREHNPDDVGRLYKHTVVIFSKNYHPDYIMVAGDLFTKLNVSEDTNYVTVNSCKYGKLYILVLNDVLDNLKEVSNA